MTYERLWAVEEPRGWRLGLRPAEVIWDSDGAGELLDAARAHDYTVRGPYVLESNALSEGEARALLEIAEADALEHGSDLPHQGGTWPAYRDTVHNLAYLKLLAILGIPADPSWKVSG